VQILLCGGLINNVRQKGSMDARAEHWDKAARLEATGQDDDSRGDYEMII